MITYGTIYVCMILSLTAAPSQKRSVQHELLLLALLPLIDRASRRLRRINILSDRLGNLAATTFLLGRLQLGLQSYTHIHIHIYLLYIYMMLEPGHEYE